jgi:hypothetical protein
MCVCVRARVHVCVRVCEHCYLYGGERQPGSRVATPPEHCVRKMRRVCTRALSNALDEEYVCDSFRALCVQSV